MTELPYLPQHVAVVTLKRPMFLHQPTSLYDRWFIFLLFTPRWHYICPSNRQTVRHGALIFSQEGPGCSGFPRISNIQSFRGECGIRASSGTERRLHSSGLCSIIMRLRHGFRHGGGALPAQLKEPSIVDRTWRSHHIRHAELLDSE